MSAQEGQKIRSAIAGGHAIRMIVTIPIFFLGIAASIRSEQYTIWVYSLPFVFYTVYLLYADYNGGIWWNNDKIWKRKKDYRWFRATPVAADLNFADLTLVESEVYIPQGDIRMTDVYDCISLYGPEEGAPPVIKLGFQYHMKRDLVELMETLNTRYPEKCSDAIRAYINS